MEYKNKVKKLSNSTADHMAPTDNGRGGGKEESQGKGEKVLKRSMKVFTQEKWSANLAVKDGSLCNG